MIPCFLAEAAAAASGAPFPSPSAAPSFSAGIRMLLVEPDPNDNDDGGGGDSADGDGRDDERGYDSLAASLAMEAAVAAASGSNFLCRGGCGAHDRVDGADSNNGKGQTAAADGDKGGEPSEPSDPKRPPRTCRCCRVALVVPALETEREEERRKRRERRNDLRQRRRKRKRGVASPDDHGSAPAGPQTTPDAVAPPSVSRSASGHPFPMPCGRRGGGSDSAMLDADRRRGPPAVLDRIRVCRVRSFAQLVRFLAHAPSLPDHLVPSDGVVVLGLGSLVLEERERERRRRRRRRTDPNTDQKGNGYGEGYGEKEREEERTTDFDDDEGGVGSMRVPAKRRPIDIEDVMKLTHALSLLADTGDILEERRNEIFAAATATVGGRDASPSTPILLLATLDRRMHLSLPSPCAAMFLGMGRTASIVRRRRDDEEDRFCTGRPQESTEWELKFEDDRSKSEGTLAADAKDVGSGMGERAFEFEVVSGVAASLSRILDGRDGSGDLDRGRASQEIVWKV